MSRDKLLGDYDGYELGDLVRHKPSGCVGMYTWMLGTSMRVVFPCNQAKPSKQPCASWPYDECELYKEAPHEH